MVSKIRIRKLAVRIRSHIFTNIIKGRGAQIKTANKFLKNEYVTDHIEGLDEPLNGVPVTQVFYENPKTIVNKVTSPDLGLMYSTNPYQGCEHGCIYCYARNSHEYWGFSAGTDFESKIIVKKNAPELIEKFIMNPRWDVAPISVSEIQIVINPWSGSMRSHAVY
jgi:hypothetical protein